MDGSVWRLENDTKRKRCTAWLQFGRLSAMVDLGRPQEGLSEIHLGSDTLAETRLLGIATDRLTAAEEVLLPEAHVRGSQLVAAYEEAPNRPLRVDASWRVLRANPTEEFLIGVELVVSVQTHLLDGCPELSAQSRLAAEETLHLRDVTSGEYQTLPLSPGRVSTVEPADGSPCLLFRLVGTDLSYAEMVHPADFRRAELTGSGEDGETVHVRHRLFSESIEKGVLLRARVRGLFLPREDDMRVAATCYAAFAAAEPPLGS